MRGGLRLCVASGKLGNPGGLAHEQIQAGAVSVGAISCLICSALRLHCCWCVSSQAAAMVASASSAAPPPPTPPLAPVPAPVPEAVAVKEVAPEIAPAPVAVSAHLLRPPSPVH